MGRRDGWIYGWMGDLPKGEKSTYPADGIPGEYSTLGPEDVANVVTCGHLRGIVKGSREGFFFFFFFFELLYVVYFE